jgi:DNA-binding NtrC family response regulator
MRRLEAHGWPGNLRELRHEMQRALVMAAGRGEILEDDLSPALAVAQRGRRRARWRPRGRRWRRRSWRSSGGRSPEALAATQGNRSHAATRLGLSRQGLLNKMDRYGLK